MKRSKANGLLLEQAVLKCLKMLNQEIKKSMFENRRCFRKTKPEIIAGLSFCNTMMTDGLKQRKGR
jgi:hypothetical protein